MDKISVVLEQIQATLASLKNDYSTLAASVDGINRRVNVLAEVKEIQDAAVVSGRSLDGSPPRGEGNTHTSQPPTADPVDALSADKQISSNTLSPLESINPRRGSLTSRIILTTYPGQAGIEPLPMHWGHANPDIRGPVAVSRNPSTVRHRNGGVLLSNRTWDSLTDLK